MQYREERKDLFSLPETYFLAHCISADFALGAGIAVQFDKRFFMKTKLKVNQPYYLENFRKEGKIADCILEGRVFNLITKEQYWDKPTYASITQAVHLMKTMCVDKGICQLGMPMIGCGLDRLQWDKVSEIIRDKFADTDVEIVVCYLEKDSKSKQK